MLWNQSWMRRPFGGRVEFTNWMGQPSYVPSTQRLENAYMMAMLRVPLPRTDDWKLMTTMGNAFLVGVSRRAGRDLSFSASAGFDPRQSADRPGDRRKNGHVAAERRLLHRPGWVAARLTDHKGRQQQRCHAQRLPARVEPLRSFGAWVQAVHGGGSPIRHRVSNRTWCSGNQTLKARTRQASGASPLRTKGRIV